MLMPLQLIHRTKSVTMPPQFAAGFPSNGRCRVNGERDSRRVVSERVKRIVEHITRALRGVNTVTDPLSLDISAILARLPHRHPFLLVDRVVEIHPGQSIRALKNVTYNEPFFTGHFPSRPLMPGVIVIEALAQTAGILSFVTAGVLPQGNTRFYLVGLDKARFRKPVMPGDQLLLCAQLERSVEAALHFSTRAFVGDNEVASAEMMIAQTANN
jgi:3-hydroxyacyl-[acyl-carrier-protein] dehydratase